MFNGNRKVMGVPIAFWFVKRLTIAYSKQRSEECTTENVRV